MPDDPVAGCRLGSERRGRHPPPLPVRGRHALFQIATISNPIKPEIRAARELGASGKPAAVDDRVNLGPLGGRMNSELRLDRDQGHIEVSCDLPDGPGQIYLSPWAIWVGFARAAAGPLLNLSAHLVPSIFALEREPG